MMCITELSFLTHRVNYGTVGNVGRVVARTGDLDLDGAGVRRHGLGIWSAIAKSNASPSMINI